jgi:hypothetical protein
MLLLHLIYVYTRYKDSHCNHVLKGDTDMTLQCFAKELKSCQVYTKKIVFVYKNAFYMKNYITLTIYSYKT